MKNVIWFDKFSNIRLLRLKKNKNIFDDAIKENAYGMRIL